MTPNEIPNLPCLTYSPDFLNAWPTVPYNLLPLSNTKIEDLAEQTGCYFSNSFWFIKELNVFVPASKNLDNAAEKFCWRFLKEDFSGICCVNARFYSQERLQRRLREGVNKSSREPFDWEACIADPDSYIESSNERISSRGWQGREVLIRMDGLNLSYW